MRNMNNWDDKSNKHPKAKGSFINYVSLEGVRLCIKPVHKGIALNPDWIYTTNFHKVRYTIIMEWFCRHCCLMAHLVGG